MKKIKNNFFIYLALILGAVSFYFIIFFGMGLSSNGKIPAGVTVAGVNLSGKTQAEANEILTQKTSDYKNGSVVLSGKKETEIKLSELNLAFDLDKTINAATKRNGLMRVGGGEVPLVFSYDKENFYQKLFEEDKNLKKEAINSKIKKDGDKIIIVEGREGERINYAETEDNLRDAVGKMEKRSEISIYVVGPTFSKKDLDQLREVGKSVTGSFVLKNGDQEIKIPEEEVLSWLYISADNNVFANRFEKDSFFAPVFGIQNGGSLFSEAEIKGTLQRLKKDIDRDPVNAKLQVKDGRAAIFVPSKTGRSLNLDKSANQIIEALAQGEAVSELVIDETKPEVTESSLNDMGISELLASGNSNFAGSPENRKHNIRTGASKFNGVLIKPDETFSFNTVLGPVDASTGYLPELVILENKTQPQFGGGLCQVSSTAFRAALNGGLPIIERKAHAYPVSYYKPFGVDATIYLPKPDLVFKNDTGKYILVQTRIEGTRLYFDFYGTKPKRSVKFSGNQNGDGAVSVVESVNPAIYDKDVRGAGSFTASFWRFIYDESGKQTNSKNFVSKYDSPDKYPKPTQQ